MGEIYNLFKFNTHSTFDISSIICSLRLYFYSTVKMNKEGGIILVTSYLQIQINTIYKQYSILLVF